MKFTTFYILRTIILFKYINYIVSECPKEMPFLQNGNCKEACNNTDNSLECILNNEILKAQYLNNIIYIGTHDYHYINIIISETDDLICLTSCYPENNTRILFGLNKKGNGYFTFQSKKSKNNILEINDTEKVGRFESQIYMLKLFNSNNDYLLSVSKCNQYIELYDLQNSKIYFEKLTNIFANSNTYQEIGTILKLKNNTQNTYIIGFLLTEYFRYLYNYELFKTNYFYLIRIEFTDLNINKNKIDRKKRIGCSNDDVQKCNDNYYTNNEISNSTIFSCYETTTFYIICFYQNVTKNILMTVYSEELNYQNETIIYSSNSIYKFFKCIHFFNNTGIFAYFDNEDIPLINFQFKDYNHSDGTITSHYNKNLILNEYNFNIGPKYNDLITINNKQFYYVTVSINTTELYIICINNYNEDKFAIRIYKIEIFKLYNYNIYSNIKIAIYNNFLALATTHTLSGLAYPSLIIFNYPNSTDFNIDVEEYLTKNNNITINKINIEISCNLENNIFGYIYTGIHLSINDISGNNNISLYTLSGEQITNDYFLEIEKAKNLSLIINKSDNYGSFTFIIEYYCSATEPNYTIFRNYFFKLIDDKEEEIYFESQRKNYSGKYSNYSIVLINELTEVKCEKNCNLCSTNNISKCITCKYDFYFIGDDKFCKIEEYEEEVSEDQENEEEKELKDYPTEENIDECSLEGIKRNLCRKKISEEKIKLVYLYYTNELINSNYKNNNKIIQTRNAKYQLSLMEDQKNSDNFELSNIDLGKCEEKIKFAYYIEESKQLIVFKLDLKSDDELKTYVYYEIYNPNTYKRITDINKICENELIIIYSPTLLNNETISLISSLSSFGYNLFNENGSFYNNICTPYTSLNKTDILLIDRKNDIFNNSGNQALCQNDCELVLYNEFNKKVKCNCNFQQKEIDIDFIKNISNIQFDKKEIIQSFFDAFTFSNFRVLKCYRLAFSFNTILKNIGRIIMTVILIILIILDVLYFINGKKILNQYFNLILNKKLEYKEKVLDKKNKNINKSKDEKMDKKKHKHHHHHKNKKNNIYEKGHKKEKPKNKKNKKKKIEKIKDENINNNNYNKKNNEIKDISCPPKYDEKTGISQNKLIQETNIDKKIKNRNNKASLSNKQTFAILNQNLRCSKLHGREILLNEQELNILDYANSLKMDKRTYWEYYWSLVKSKQLILFTFIYRDDYNIKTIKICLFIIAFSLSFTLNGFFFTDDTMHKIYKDNGVYKILYHMPIMIYSTLVSIIINLLLRKLSLTEPILLKLKQLQNFQQLEISSKSSLKCIKIKMAIFLGLSFIFLLFFWYFLTCFCSVYINTQIILIKDTLLSFCLSMIYPFVLNLLPGLFRITALRDKNKNKEYLYKISLLLAYI